MPFTGASTPISDPTRKPNYQHVEYYTYCTVLLSLNNWSINQFNNKTTTHEYFYTSHKFVLDGISDNMSVLVYNEKYVARNTADPTTIRYYFFKFLSEPYTLQDEKTMNKKVIKAGELIIKASYPSIIKTNTN